MRNRTPLALVLGAALALGAAGCSTPCRELGDRICDCSPSGTTRTNCKTNVKSRVSASAPTTEEQDLCSALLDTCPKPQDSLDTCAWMLNTCAGRVACGLALPTVDGSCDLTRLEDDPLFAPPPPGQEWPPDPPAASRSQPGPAR
jgi:hypothetical protein